MYSMIDIEIVNDDKECYICTYSDPIPWKSDCNCVDRYVHKECQIELIDKTGNIKCPVCLVDYRNIDAIYSKKFYINSKGVWVFIFFLLSFGVSICATYILVMYDGYKDKRPMVGFAGGSLLGFSTICFIMLSIFIIREGGFKKLYLDCYSPIIKLKINEPKLCV